MHPVILSMDWPASAAVLGQCTRVRSRPVETWDMSTWELPTLLMGSRGRWRLPRKRLGSWCCPPRKIFTLWFAFDQVTEIDGQLVHPDTVQSYPHFVIIRDRLYRMMGRTPRRVQDLITENWEEGPSPSKNEIQYVLDLRAKLQTVIMGELAPGAGASAAPV